MFERFVLGDEPWAAHGKDLSWNRRSARKARIFSVAEADGNVDVVPVKIENGGRHVNAHVRAGHHCKETIKARHQPFGADRRRG